jgi:predicted DNA-binding transcriptional regulator YafY
MPRKPREQGAAPGLGRSARIVGALLRGEPLDAARAAALIGVQEPAALEQLRAIESELPGVRVMREGRRNVWRYHAEPETWQTPVVVAACLGSSLAPLFRRSAHGQAFAEIRSRLVSNTQTRQRFGAVERKFWFHAQGGEQGVDASPALFDNLVDALLDSVTVTMSYEHFDGQLETLAVAPLSLVLYQHQLYLLAQPAQRKVHPFRVARILSLTRGKPFRYPPPTQFNPEDLFKDSLGIWINAEGPIETVVVHLGKHWATYARTHRWHPTQSVRSIRGAVEVSFRCRLCRELTQWVLAFGSDAKVIKPAGLRTAIKREVTSMAAVYREDSKLGRR